jgi:hypothetical protein
MSQGFSGAPVEVQRVGTGADELDYRHGRPARWRLSVQWNTVEFIREPFFR